MTKKQRRGHPRGPPILDHSGTPGPIHYAPSGGDSRIRVEERSFFQKCVEQKDVLPTWLGKDQTWTKTQCVCKRRQVAIRRHMRLHTATQAVFCDSSALQWRFSQRMGSPSTEPDPDDQRYVQFQEIASSNAEWTFFYKEVFQRWLRSIESFADVC